MLLLSINNTRARLAWTEPGNEAAPALRQLYLGPTAELTATALTGAVPPELAGKGNLVLSSVVPAAEERIRGWLEGFTIVRVTAQLHLNFSLAEYPGRATLGADRIANLAAATALYPLPALILDLGTAVTLDLLDAACVYRGGMIAPGLRLFSDYLPARTALLPQLPPGTLPAVAGLGQDTVGAMHAGVRHGFTGMLHGLLQAALAVPGAAAAQSVIVTGGDAALVTEPLARLGLPVAVHHAPDLAFLGMRLLGDLNASAPPPPA